LAIYSTEFIGVYAASNQNAIDAGPGRAGDVGAQTVADG
jgi:hypothetical protein